MEKQAARERGTGRYCYDGGFERLCRCGHELGVHSGEKANGEQPCFSGDFGGEPCDCDCFKLARKRK